MHIFEGRYFRMNKKFLTLTGLWPYKSKTKKVIRIVFMAVMFTSAIPHLISAIRAVHGEDVDRLMLSLIGVMSVMVGMFKAVGLIATEDKVEKLCESIADNWLKIQDENEREILHEYSERGRLLTLLQSGFMSSCFVITLLPLVPKILDKVCPLTEPRPSMYILQGEFFVDREANFVVLCLVDCVTITMIIVVAIATDTMYIASSQHCCALYAIVSHRLRKLRRMEIEDHDSCDWLVQTIKLHQRALTFTSTLNESYSTTFLLIIPLNMVAIPLVSCAILANLDKPLNLLPYIAYFVAVAVHVFILCWPGQTIFDHGISLCTDAYGNEWYATPLHTKKLLLIFMLQCAQPASITAGGLILLNYETFSMVIRTAISYITVAASFR